jgi:hypothetical protein
MEGPGDHPVAALVRMQPVHRPHPPVIGLRGTGSVEVQCAEPRGDRIQHRVNLLCPPRQRPREHSWQAEHPAGIRQPHRQHLGTSSPKCRNGTLGRRGDQLRIKVRAQRIVDAEYHARDIGPQAERPRQLILLDLDRTCAAGGQDMQLRVGQTIGKQGRPAPPGATAANRIADAERDRVTERREGGHADAPTAATPSTAS